VFPVLPPLQIPLFHFLKLIGHSFSSPTTRSKLLSRPTFPPVGKPPLNLFLTRTILFVAALFQGPPRFSLHNSFLRRILHECPLSPPVDAGAFNPFLFAKSTPLSALSSGFNVRGDSHALLSLSLHRNTRSRPLFFSCPNGATL